MRIREWKKTRERVVSALLAGVVLAGMVPQGVAWAEEVRAEPQDGMVVTEEADKAVGANTNMAAQAGNTLESGNYGKNLTWTLDDDGTLTMNGEGKMMSVRPSLGEKNPLEGIKGSVTKIIIVEGVESIGASAFSGFKNLQEITMADSVKVIEQGAFSGCSGLISVTVSRGIESIGPEAFGYCSGLRTVHIGSNVKEIGKYAFRECKNIQQLTLENGVEHIAECAFLNCTGVTEIVIPNSVSRIEKGAFAGCTSLEGITLPYVEDLTRANDDTDHHHFGYIFGTSKNDKCVKTEPWSTSLTKYEEYYIPLSLKRVVINGGNVPARSFRNCTQLTEVVFGADVTEMGEDVFYNCHNLEMLTLPFTGDQIRPKDDLVCYTFGYLFGTTEYKGGVATFQWYRNGKDKISANYYIPESLKSVTIVGGSIREDFFYNCANIKTIVMANGVTEIGDGAFQNCGIAEIEIGNGVERIGARAFAGCDGLTKIVVPSNVNKIGRQAFDCCKKLQEVVIEQGVGCLDEKTFFCCSDLACISLSESMAEIKQRVFEGCDKLKDIYYAGSSRRWERVSIADSGNSAMNVADIHFAKVDITGQVENVAGTVSLKADSGTSYCADVLGTNYTIRDVPTGGYTLCIEKTGYVPYSAAVNATTDIDVGTIRLAQIGDVNGNGSVDASDMACLYEKLSTGSYNGQLTDEEYQNAVLDINGDGMINILDYQKLYVQIAKAS